MVKDYFKKLLMAVIMTAVYFAVYIVSSLFIPPIKLRRVVAAILGVVGMLALVVILRLRNQEEREVYVYMMEKYGYSFKREFCYTVLSAEGLLTALVMVTWLVPFFITGPKGDTVSITIFLFAFLIVVFVVTAELISFLLWLLVHWLWRR